ncbi:myb/SANT-like DNA-binding domain-containing protein 3, partial [Acyrthosiphon pisum]|uniref:Regulatory protein zeste n=1 Tax=Acyrthosiphon pisum TaxID=7029 RepID=A0A8R2JX34_ACYPI
MAKRAPNFTQSEIEWLLHYVDKNKNVLECKKSDVNTYGMKIKTWKRIEEEFNASSNGEHRSTQVLRKKWENVKKRAKEKAAEEKHEIITTGGGRASSTKFSDEEKRVIEIIGEEQVSGSRFEFDCDN